MRVHVRYPSGQAFRVTGTWHGPQQMLTGPNHLGTRADAVAMELPDRPEVPVLLMDPRGLFIDLDTGTVLYTPEIVDMEKYQASLK